MSKDGRANKILTVPALRSGPAYRFLFETAPRILRAHRLPILSYWLTETTLEAAASKIMRIRLHYERNAWPERHNRIQALCQTSMEGIASLEGDLANVTASPFEVATIDIVIDTAVSDRIDGLLRQGLMEVRRLVSYEVQHSQSVVAEYFLRPVDERGMLRRSLRVLRTHLQTTATSISDLLSALAPWTRESISMNRNGFVERWEDRLRAGLTNEAPYWARARYGSADQTPSNYTAYVQRVNDVQVEYSSDSFCGSRTRVSRDVWPSELATRATERVARSTPK